MFIPKAGKDPSSPGSYRPLMLLSTIGKLYERCLMQRILDPLDAWCPLHPKQFGFHQALGTEDCIHAVIDCLEERRQEYYLTAMTLLDIKGAFDHVLWPHVIAELSSRVPWYLCCAIEVYFTEHLIMGDGTHFQPLEHGVPQGSVLAPLLWNVGYDIVLKTLDSEMIEASCYTDDTLLVASAPSLKGLRTEVRCQINVVSELLDVCGLESNISTTGILLMDRTRRLRPRAESYPTQLPTFNVNGTTITPAKVINYLGVWVDSRLAWKEHI